MDWQITFFNEKVETKTMAFPRGILANLFHTIDIMEEFGPMLGEPYTKALGSGLFEIRAKGKEGIGRSLFCTVKGKKIIILHSFIKKSQKIPKRELDLAKRRMKEIQK
jgi:phage-related protein